METVRRLHRTGGGLLHGQPGGRRPLGHPGGHSAQGSRRERGDARRGGERGSPARGSLSLPPTPSLTGAASLPAPPQTPLPWRLIRNSEHLQAEGCLPRETLPPTPTCPGPSQAPQLLPGGSASRESRGTSGAPGAWQLDSRVRGWPRQLPAVPSTKGPGDRARKGLRPGTCSAAPRRAVLLCLILTRSLPGGCCGPRFTGLPMGPAERRLCLPITVSQSSKDTGVCSGCGGQPNTLTPAACLFSKQRRGGQWPGTTAVCWPRLCQAACPETRPSKCGLSSSTVRNAEPRPTPDLLKWNLRHKEIPRAFDTHSDLRSSGLGPCPDPFITQARKLKPRDTVTCPK